MLLSFCSSTLSWAPKGLSSDGSGIKKAKERQVASKFSFDEQSRGKVRKVRLAGGLICGGHRRKRWVSKNAYFMHLHPSPDPDYVRAGASASKGNSYGSHRRHHRRLSAQRELFAQD